MRHPNEFQRFRAPTEDGAALVDPGWPRLLAQLATPATLPSLSLGSKPLTELAELGRRELLEAAQRYTRSFTDAPEVTPGAPLVLSGHQPELFHPGVWFKNFALDRLSKAVGGVGVHLLIDSDLCRKTAIRVPTGGVSEPRLESVAFDAPAGAMPYEERRLVDGACLESFSRRVKEVLEPLVSDPLIREMADDLDAAMRRTPLLRDILSAPRRLAEGRSGVTTLEAPLSTIEEGEAFRRLAAELLVRAPETRAAYNAALAEYRAVHRLRSRAQPLPDLAAEEAWCEAPLWVWSEADPVRRPLFVRRRGDRLELSDRAAWHSEGPADADGIVAWLGELRARGVKLRSRALVTTLFCRLVLSDLFLHGIGGAKYDQVTDRFALRLFGVEPPPHATLSATLRLPIELPAVGAGDRVEALRRLRDLRYRPEAFVEPGHPVAATKRRWVATPKTPANAAQRHAAIHAANQELVESLKRQREAAVQDLARVESGLRSASMLGSREFAFCLYPADVRQRLSSLASTYEKEP